MFHYSPKKGAILESVQNIYGKKPLKMLKATVTRWLTHGRVSKRILDCFRELVETIDQFCLTTAESEARGYRALLTNHKAFFCVCFMTAVLSIMSTLSLVLQKEGALPVDIQCSVDLTLGKYANWLQQIHQINTSTFWHQQKVIMLLTKNILTC